MEKDLNSFSVSVNGIMINGRVLCIGNDLYVSLPNEMKHFIVEDRFHYWWEKSHYNIALTLHPFDDEKDKWELHIEYINDYCSRAMKLVKLSEKNNENFVFHYPLIGETKYDVYDDKFAIFDIHSVKKQVALRDCPFSCNFESKLENDNRILFCSMYDCGNGYVKNMCYYVTSF